MNKKLKVLPILAMGLMLVACNGGTSSSSKPTSKNDDVTFTLKVGSYVAMAGEDNPNTIEVSTAAVILNSENKIVSSYFDVLQAPFAITSVTDTENNNNSVYTLAIDKTKNQTKDAGDKVIETKQELKEKYGMSDIGKTEWYKQASAFSAYINNKTIEEATSANYKNPNNPDGSVVIEGCTMSQTNFTTALKVITDTKTFKAPANTVSAGLGYKVNALGTDNVLTVTIAGSATDKDGKVYETSLNAYQIPVMVDANDATKIAFNPTNAQYNSPYAQLNAANFKGHTTESGENTYYTEVLSKRELKDLYGMKDKATSGEWFTQANSFAAYAKNKNVSVLQENLGKYKSVENESGTVEIAGCTINMDDFATSIVKSNTNKSGLKAK